MDSKFERSIRYIGEQVFNQIRCKTLIICGLGGVGGTCFEALVRTGFTNFKIVDFDTVSPSNMNRQILFTSEEIGQNKVDSAIKRAKSINPDINIKGFNMKITENSILEIGQGDYIIDAIDDVDGKIAIAKYAEKNNIPLIVSLGMANRINPSDVFITRLNKTTDDPLAKKVRYLFKKEGINVNNIDVAFSKEAPKKDGVNLNSLMFSPSAAGLNIASYVLNFFIKSISVIE